MVEEEARVVFFYSLSMALSTLVISDIEHKNRQSGTIILSHSTERGRRRKRDKEKVLTDAPKGRAFIFAVFAIIAIAADGAKDEGATPLLRLIATAASLLLLATNGAAAPLACGASVERIFLVERKRKRREKQLSESAAAGRKSKNEKKKPKRKKPTFLHSSSLSPSLPLSLLPPNSGPPPAPEKRDAGSHEQTSGSQVPRRRRRERETADGSVAEARRKAPHGRHRADGFLEGGTVRSLSSPSEAAPAPRLAAHGRRRCLCVLLFGWRACQEDGLRRRPRRWSESIGHAILDPVSNGRLVALCLAQMLCSVATLIHDT